MDNSWVKLYRKVGDNPIMLDDKACRVFLWLLIHVNKKTGQLTAGRFQISQDLRINPSTIYKVLQRLEKKYQICNIKSNNKFTEISLTNWAKYNPYDEKVTQDDNNKVTTKEQQSNTYTRHIDNKDIKTNDKSLQRYGNAKINELMDFFLLTMKLQIMDESVAKNRQYANLCIKKFGFEQTKIAITAASQSKFWHTKVTSFKDLYYKAVKIVTSLRGEVKSLDVEKVLGNHNERQKGIPVNGGRIRSIEAGIPQGD